MFHGKEEAAASVRGIDCRTSVFAPRFATSTHVHERAYCCVVLGGTSVQRAGRVERRRDRGRVYFYPAGEPQSETFGASGGRLFSVSFASDVRLPDASAELTGSAAIAARRIALESRQHDTAAPLALESLTASLIGALTRESCDDAPRWAARVRDYLHAHFDEKLVLGDVARVAGVHPVHLSRAFPRRFGLTLGDYVRALRIDRAARELVATARPIAEIALDAGFASQSHFTTCFKARMHVTPAAYRARG
ncbi:MAG TPA: AraC family transcriptional regulator [Thermoanaerobaculia bacterium]|jgi:AraC family transcriptional regulator